MDWQEACSKSPVRCAVRVDRYGWRWTRDRLGDAVVDRGDGRIHEARCRDIEGHGDWEPCEE